MPGKRSKMEQSEDLSRNSQKRKSASPPEKTKKRKSSVTTGSGHCQSRKSQTLQTDPDTKCEDELWTRILISLKEYTKEELKMFESDTDEKAETATDDVDDNSYLTYSKFLCQLVEKFVKLRRFPKLFAKLLCCLRDNFARPGNVSADKNGNAENKEVPDPGLLIPNIFLVMTSSVIAALPGGQIIDLWKTLHHNLREECINALCVRPVNPGLKVFTLVVSDLFCHFLANVKVVDYAVQTITIEKVSELMASLSTDCLAKFGSYVLSAENDQDLMKTFLKLAHAWAELHGLQLFYNNQRYKGNQPAIHSDFSPMNLTYLHPYLTPEFWLQLEHRVDNLDDSSCTLLKTKLVAQKLKFMLALEKRPLVTEVDSDLQKQLSASSKYIWSNEEIYGSTTEIYTLASEFLDDSEITGLASNYVKELQADRVSDALKKVVIPQDFQLHYAILLEIIVQILTRLAKIKCYKKMLTKVTKVILSLENRSYLLRQDIRSQSVFQLLLESLNDIIRTDLEEDHSDLDFSYELVFEDIRFLSDLNLEDYPLHVRSVLATSSLIILIPLVKTASEGTDSVLNMMSSIFSQCGKKCYGSEFLFHIHWAKLFHWFQTHNHIFSRQAQREIVPTILQNIYISKTSAVEFETEFEQLCDEFQSSNSNTNVGLLALEFLIQDQKKAVKEKRKGVGEIIQSHKLKLSQCVIKSLSSVSNKGKGKTDSTRTNFFRSCWLLRMVEENEEKSDETPDNHGGNLNFKILNKVLGEQVKSAFVTLSVSSSASEDDDLKDGRLYALILLHSVCKSREEFKEILPEEFASDLWNITLKLTTNDWEQLQNFVPKENIHSFPKVICENATPLEFEKVLHSLDAKLDAEKAGASSKLLEDIIDAKLSPEKRNLRGQFLEKFLFSLLKFNLQLNSSDDCINKVVLPLLHLQTKLLSRKTISNQIALANCLTSVTTAPLNDINDTGVYRKVFCAVGDLMNAFTLHRLDVLSFRTHVYLQCFEFLAKSLIAKANQTNKLSDPEVGDLRYCAHALERICQSTKSGKKEFARIAPYLLAFMMKQFETYTVYPSVKDPLMSGCYKLLNLTDSHGVAQTNSMLTVGSRGIFTGVFELYNKFYRYKGKV